MGDSAPESDGVMAGEGGKGSSRLQVTFVPSNVWRAGLVVLAVVALGLFLNFIIDDGGGVIFTVLMSWFAAIAMAPLVNRLSRHMRRGVATMIVIVSGLLFAVVFLLLFGALFVDQLAQLVMLIPDLVDEAIMWANQTFGLSLSQGSLLDMVGLSTEDMAAAATQIGVTLLGFVVSVVGSIFGIFTFALFTFYLSADMPRLERWIASLFPPRMQDVVFTVWTTTAQKTGGYIGARVILAGINSATSGVVFVIIGMPYWLPLALWTGIVAQFVPTIGTYIAIVLPVIVGLLSGSPWIGVAALIWAIVYQQVENLTIEPRISAKAVDVNPAVAFGSVLLGAALFGVAGAFLAVPVAAMLLALLQTYGKRYELLPEMLAKQERDYQRAPRKVMRTEQIPTQEGEAS
ncbi:MAG TPA: AI-2E family transporter [Actinobacteria bacterium]|jgi:predicted PurR-regulated permease PerM|nr:AI-2E family transporter [Actinomycetota bacterium]